MHRGDEESAELCRQSFRTIDLDQTILEHPPPVRDPTQSTQIHTEQVGDVQGRRGRGRPPGRGRARGRGRGRGRAENPIPEPYIPDIPESDTPYIPHFEDPVSSSPVHSQVYIYFTVLLCFIFGALPVNFVAYRYHSMKISTWRIMWFISAAGDVRVSLKLENRRIRHARLLRLRRYPFQRMMTKMKQKMTSLLLYDLEEIGILSSVS